jgi:signal transduction histidine kinase
LFVIQGRNRGTRFDLPPREGAVSIGREAGNVVQLDDNEVSRRHAEIRQVGQTHVLGDLKSSNGTFVNSRRVERAELQHGDQILVGRTLLSYSRDSSTDAPGDQVEIVAPIPEEGSRIVKALKDDPLGGPTGAPGDTDDRWLARARSNLQVMYRTALAVSHTLDIDELLGRILQLVFEWVEADRGCVMLLDPESGQLRTKARRDRRSANVSSMAISRTILDYVLDRGEGVLTSDAQDDDRFSSGHSVGHQAALAVEDTTYYSAMVQSERLAAVGHTIATLSHHIKNILQGIRGGSYLVEMGLENEDLGVVKKGWDIVSRNQNKISSLVMDMLSFSKEREPDPVPTDLVALVTDIVETVHHRAAEAGTTIRWNPPTDIPRMLFDPEGISRAVLNVVTNALDAVEGRLDAVVEIRVTVDAKARKTRITVTDNGEGIPPETLARIFNLFVSTKGSRGTGLGLTVSKKILKEHNGDIRAESRVGEGSTFTLEFPLLLAGDHPPGLSDDDGHDDDDDDGAPGPSTSPGAGAATSQRTLSPNDADRDVRRVPRPVQP